MFSMYRIRKLKHKDPVYVPDKVAREKINELIGIIEELKDEVWDLRRTLESHGIYN